MNLIGRWAHTHDLGPLAHERKFAVSFDRVRVHLLELAPSQVMLEARICDLPSAPTERERTLRRLLAIALARAGASANHVMVDDDQSAFWLQRRLPPSAELAELDLALEQLVNDIELWRAAL